MIRIFVHRHLGGGNFNNTTKAQTIISEQLMRNFRGFDDEAQTANLIIKDFPLLRAIKRFLGKNDGNSVVSIKGKMESQFRSAESKVKTQKYNQKITYQELKDVLSEKKILLTVITF